MQKEHSDTNDITILASLGLLCYRVEYRLGHHVCVYNVGVGVCKNVVKLFPLNNINLVTRIL